MDIFSHGLWAGVAAHAVNLKTRTRVSVWKTGLWGVAPDLFSFTIAFAWMFATGRHFNAPDAEPFSGNGQFIYRFTEMLYAMSHSVVIFALLFGLALLLFKRPLWEMGGWLFHILIDVPTHSYAFFPTPVLWPLSEWKFDGFYWGQAWFIVADAVALIVAYGVVWYVYRGNIKR